MAARKHFSSILKRYGAPVLVWNLIKQKESRPRETVVGSQFKRCMSFINSVLPNDYKIDFKAWDFKECQRSTERSVVDELTAMAEWSLQRTGFFHSKPSIHAIKIFGKFCCFWRVFVFFFVVFVWGVYVGCFAVRVFYGRVRNFFTVLCGQT